MAALLTVHRKRNVSTQEQELAALEQRLREAEERLAQASGSSPPQQPTSSPSTNDSSQRQASAGAGQPTSSPPEAAYAPAGLRPTADRADSSFYPPMPGAMPRTPTPRYNATEYVSVDRSR